MTSKRKEIETILYSFNNKIKEAEELERENPSSSKLKKLDKEIRLINDGLDSIMYDKFYFIIEYKYLEGWDKKRILKEFNIDYSLYEIQEERLLMNLIRFIKL